jgi:hypothetical protein
MAENRGQFKKGNTVGMETRFKEGNTFAVKYKDEYCEKMLEYFRNATDFPTFEEFAGEIIGVGERTLWEWKNNHPRFATTFEKCLAIQKGMTLKGAMIGKYNAAFAKFMAVNCYGMTDKSENDSKMTVTITQSAEIDEESN